jgi:8-oxo-dGTP pyrophosphatase MutT (NUDIX family)
VIGPALWRLRAVIRPPVSLGVRALVRDGGRVLLVRHTYMAGLHLPGGAVDPGESARAAMAREVAEETGVVVAGDSRLFHLYWNRRLAGRDHVALFVARPEGHATGGFRPGREIAEAAFFPIDRLPEEVTPATRRRLEEVLSGAPPSEDW